VRRHEFEVYLDKVFDFSGQVHALPEGRQYPRHPWPKIFQAVFLGAACQFPTLHRIEAECHNGVLAKRIGPLSEDDIGYALERQAAEPVFLLGCQIARQLKRNGVLRSAWARGRIVASVDGIEICRSFVRCCDQCLERKVTHKVAGVEGEDIQYYHRLVAVVVVSAAFAVPLGIRFLRPGEDEVGPAGALLADLVKHLGRRFVDILVADAVYLQRPFVQRVEQLGLEWVFTLKENQPDLLAEAVRVTARPPDHCTSDPSQALNLWHASEVYWPVADRSVRVVKAVRTLRKRQVTVRREPAAKTRTRRDQVSETSTNYSASNVDLGSIPPQFIYALGRSRWRIDVDVFQTLTTDCHLKRPSVHQNRSQALVLLTMIRVLAYLLSLVFYHRQICSHWHGRARAIGFSQFARDLGYRFLRLRFDSS
jgi:hypothetical protein